MIRALGNLINPKHWGPFVEAAEITRFDHGFTVSWSQGGEDLAILSYVGGIQNGSYVDVGAHHPDRFSVTRHLYQRGWSGINVEANPALLPAFHAKRPRDINLNFAVGLAKEYELTIFSEPAISTVNNDWRDRFEKENQTIERVVKVPGVTLLELFDMHFPTKQIDLLCVDAEGSDFEVLQSLQLESVNPNRQPRWILVETAPRLKQVLNQEHVKYLNEHGYEIVVVLPMSTLFQLEFAIE
jgi:FkbM family methyltransferase